VGTAGVFRAVLANRDLRRVELAFAGFNAAEFAVWIALLVFAYERGGATEASLVAVLQLVPAALCAPFLALLADRHRPARVLAGSYLAQAAGMGVTAIAIASDAPVAVIYAGAVIASVSVTVSRPAQAVIVPSLARTAEELTATNVVSSWVESVGVLVATAFAGAVLSVSGVDVVFGLMAAVVLVSALLVAGIDRPEPAMGEDAQSALAEALAGFRALGEHSHLRSIVGLLLGEFLLWGAMDLLFVVLAFDVLDLGQGWAGYLNAAFAAGSVLGGIAAVVLVGRRLLAPPIAVGVLTCGAAVVAIALWPTTAVVVVLLALSGAGRVVVDVGCRTLLQRTTPSEVLGRVFGVLEGVMMAGLALGALVVPALVALGGSNAALIGVGLLLPAFGVLMARPLIRVDRATKVPVVEIALLRSMSPFSPLPAPALEGVARALERVDLPAGTVVIRMGDEGDRFYAIAEGEVEVSRDGRAIACLSRGEGFGEIALLDDVPRTATVTALTDVLLYALEKDPFLTAVTGHAPAAQAARALVAERRAESARHAADQAAVDG
jgi:MFS family permease